MDGAGHADLIKGGIGKVTNLQGGVVAGGKVAGDEYARALRSRIRKSEAQKIVVGQLVAGVGPIHRFTAIFGRRNPPDARGGRAGR